MSYYRRFLPFLKPYLPKMLTAALLVMGVAAVNLTLLRVAGALWDLITVQRDLAAMTQALGPDFVAYFTRIKQAEVERHAAAQDPDDFERREYFSRL